MPEIDFLWWEAAALSITNLYRSSRTTSKRSYNSGYAAACADLLQMIQQGVSDSETPLSIGRVMDWVEARLEAVRAREEEELEEDEETSSKKEGQASKLKASNSLARASSAPAVPQQHQSPREQPVGFLSSSPPSPSPRVYPFAKKIILMIALSVGHRDLFPRRNYRNPSLQHRIHDPQRHLPYPPPHQPHRTLPAVLKRKHVPPPRPCRQRRSPRRAVRRQTQCPSSTPSLSPPTPLSPSPPSRLCRPPQHPQRQL